jgi:hypothetical protein
MINVLEVRETTCLNELDDHALQAIHIAQFG